MEQPNVYYDIIIANPPYGRIGNEITRCIVNNLEWGVYVNLMPVNDYRRFNKDNKLYQFVDISSMKPVINGFADAVVTTHMTLIDKERSNLSEDEFEIENYIDPQLKKYFYENRKREHYAIDGFVLQPTFKQFCNSPVEKTVYIGQRDVSHGHMPYSKNCLSARYNRNEVTCEQVIAEAAKSMQALGRAGSFYIFAFDTAKEKTNFSNFIYSKDGFRFISKIFVAMNVDGACMLSKVFPKVSWTKPQTVQSILKDYGYTKPEIDEVMDDLKNFKYMNDE